jgi:hypothetical protein
VEKYLRNGREPDLAERPKGMGKKFLVFIFNGYSHTTKIIGEGFCLSPRGGHSTFKIGV